MDGISADPTMRQSDTVTKVLWRTYTELTAAYDALKKENAMLHQLAIDLESQIDKLEEDLFRYESDDLDEPPHHISHE